MKDRRAMFQNAAAIKNSMTDLRNDIKVEIPKPQPPVEEPIIEEQPIIVEEQPTVEEPTVEEPIVEEQPIEFIEEIKNIEPISLVKKKKNNDEQQ